VCTKETRSGLFGDFLLFLPDVAATMWSKAIRFAVDEDEDETPPIMDVALLWSMSNSSIVVTITF
jgi:hypothetical protein